MVTRERKPAIPESDAERVARLDDCRLGEIDELGHATGTPGVTADGWITLWLR
jgi:hypothetical protein